MNISTIKKDYFKTFIPITLTMMGFFLYNITDSYFVAMINEEALAGMGLIAPLAIFIIVLFNTIGGAISIHIGSAFGGKLINRIKKKILIGSIITFLVSLILFLFFFTLSEEIKNTYDATDNIKNYFSGYYGYWVWTILLDGFIVIYAFTLNSTGQASKDTKINLFAISINIILDYLLIFGYKDFIPAMGIEGAALATLVVKIIQLLLLSYILFKEKLLIFKIKKSHYLVLFKKIKKLVIPMALQGIIIPISVFVFALLVTKYSSSEIVAWTLFMRLESLVFMVGAAINISIGILMSKYYGQKQFKKIPLVLNLSNRIGIIWVAFLLFTIIVFGREIGSIFLQNPESIEVFYFTAIIGLGSYIFGAPIGNINKSFTTLKKPYLGLIISAFRSIVGVMLLPFIFSIWYGYYGLFYGFSLGMLLTLWFAYYLFKTKMNKDKNLHFSSIF